MLFCVPVSAGATVSERVVYPDDTTMALLMLPCYGVTIHNTYYIIFK